MRISRSIVLVVALMGCHNGGTGNGPDGNPNTNPGDDTGTPSTMGFVSATVEVLGSPEACQANILDGDDVVATDNTGDRTPAEVEPGSYTTTFGIAVDMLFAEHADDISDLVDGMPLHPDENGDYWASPAQNITVTSGLTAEVVADMSRVFAFCPDSDRNGVFDASCNEPGQWTCEEDGETYPDIMSIEQNEDGTLSIYVPCIGDLNLDGERIFSDGYYDGGFVGGSGYMEVTNLHNSSNDVRLWVGDDGDEP